MAIQYRYQNLNPYPVMVPDKRGLMHTFLPNQGTNDQWFSRFVGNKKLSRTAVTHDSLKPAIAAKPVKAELKLAPDVAVAVASSPMLKALVADEDTRFYRREKGIYHCKMCEIFRTGSQQAVIAHLASQHKIDVQRAAESDAEMVAKKIAMKAEIEAKKIAAENEAAMEKVGEEQADKPTDKPPPVNPELTFKCDRCPKAFKSDRGLRMHTIRMHPSVKKE